MLSFQIASRFRRAKQSNRYISFISFSSTLGIGLGCFVLIVLLSIMNGFEKELRQRLLSVIPHAELFSISSQGINEWKFYSTHFSKDPRIEKVQPYTKLTGMLQKGKALKAVELTGVDFDYTQNDGWQTAVSAEALKAFSQNERAVLLGKGIVEKLSLTEGESISLLLPSDSEDLSFQAPKTIRLELAGTISIGGETDNLIGMMHLSYASESAKIVSGAQGLRFTMKDPFDSHNVIREIGYNFRQPVYMSDWTRTQGHLYEDIKLVRVVVYIALTLVIAVACFNIVSTLVMAVREKRSAIAILKTMGAQNNLIKRIFIFQGMINGLLGISVGCLSAIVIAPNLASIVRAVESVTGYHILSADIYFIDFLPSDLHWQDVIITALVALLLCVVATLYPAHKAAKISPSKALS